MKKPIPTGTMLIVIAKGEQREYRCVGVAPYIRKLDGASVALYTWEGECSVCGEKFRDQSGREIRVSAHCEKHRLRTSEQRLKRKALSDGARAG